MVDSNDRDRIVEAKDELHRMLNEVIDLDLRNKKCGISKYIVYILNFPILCYLINPGVFLTELCRMN